MSGLRFFATELDATDAGIPLLDVGTSADLGGEPYPIIRLAGRDEAGGLLFDHTGLCMRGRDAQLLGRAVDALLADDGLTNGVTRQELNYLRQRLRELEQLLRVRERVGRLVHTLAQGESVALNDEGGTTIRCTCEHPANYTVSRWGESVRDGVDARLAVDLALEDRGLPPGRDIVSDAVDRPRRPQGDPEAGAWQGIVDALGEHGFDAWFAQTGGGARAIQITWPGPGDEHALLAGAGPLCCAEDRECNAGENWTLAFYREGIEASITLDGTDVARTDDDARVANLVAALLLTGFAESSGGF